MKHDTNTDPGTLPDPAADGLREIERLRADLHALRAWSRRAIYVLNTAAAVRNVDPESGSLRYISGECEICAGDGMAIDRDQEGGDR